MQCMTPMSIYRNGKTEIVPCGKCPNCLSRNRSGFNLRLSTELKNSVATYFVTLTYSNENLPLKPTKDGSIEPAFNKRHLQLYLKFLRNKGLKFKYFAVAEYGERLHRPHYHFLLFCKEHTDSIADLLNEWKYGNIHIAHANVAALHYCTKDMLKIFDKNSQTYENDLPDLPGNQFKPFKLISKGLGIDYVTIYQKWHKSDLNRSYAVLEGGKKVHLPRYLKNKIYNEDERFIQKHRQLNRIVDNTDYTDSTTFRASEIKRIRRVEIENQKLKKIKHHGKNL